jgi:hypothetical protein
VLISEEHSPEGDATRLTSTIPAKRFRFLEDILRQYSHTCNVFVLSHTLLRGTTALSDDWGFNDTRAWTAITREFFRLFDAYPVVAHLTGHTHIDYRYRSVITNIDGTRRNGKVGKLVDGRDCDSMPGITFLNMPCVDTAHGWVGGNFALLRRMGKPTARARRSPVRKLYIHVEEKGPPIFDILYRSPINRILGRAAVYHMDLVPGQDHVTVVTRWLRPDKDIERYTVDLHQPIEAGTGKMELLASDLSVRTKESLHIPRDDWFLVPANEHGWGTFSQRFPEPIAVRGLALDATGLRDHTVKWKGSRDGGKNWDGTWRSDPRELGQVNAVLLAVDLYAGDAGASVQDMVVKWVR